MYRKAFTIFLLFTIGLHTGGEAFLNFWYRIGNRSFERAFCTNLERPELECHGQCHLEKMAFDQQVEDQPQAPNPSGEEKRFSSLYPEPERLTWLASSVFRVRSLPLFRYDNPAGTLFIHFVFRPPWEKRKPGDGGIIAAVLRKSFLF